MRILFPSLKVGALFLCGLSLGAFGVGAQPLPLTWPTPNSAWLEGRGQEDFLQPTASGNLHSALFGCVRRNADGSPRFHEGLDLKSIQRDRRGESTDPIFAILPGVVVHVSRVAGHSSYGIYVVIEHQDIHPPIHSMYAHLRSVDESIRPGVRVREGQQIGIMGRTAGGYTIPRERAHLHLEMGFRITDDFQRWFDQQGFGSPNRHGRFNGMNLVGFDPLDFFTKYRAGEVRSVLDYLRAEPVGFTLQVNSRKVPDFIQRYPHLLGRPIPAGGPRAWEIDFTWYGLPVRWTPLTTSPGERGEVRVVWYDEELMTANACRRTLLIRRGQPVLGAHTERVLELLF